MKSGTDVWRLGWSLGVFMTSFRSQPFLYISVLCLFSVIDFYPCNNVSISSKNKNNIFIMSYIMIVPFWYLYAQIENTHKNPSLFIIKIHPAQEAYYKPWE